MNELPEYSKLLSNNGILVLSGFYTEDIADLNEIASQNNLVLEDTKSRNNWAMMHLSPSKL